MLARANGRRAFRRLGPDELAELLGGGRKATRASRAGGAGGAAAGAGSDTETGPPSDGGPLRSE